jgi:chromosome partitioning protein
LIVVAIANGKGGVGKSSVAAHLAVWAARHSWRTLAVDLDRQGSLAHDLGYEERITDETRFALEDAMVRNRTLVPLADVRANLAVVPGGWPLTDLSHRLAASLQREGMGAFARLRNALESVADDYDLVVLDLPPGDPMMQTIGITAGDLVVIPTSLDHVSTIQGTRTVLDHVAVAQTLRTGALPRVLGWIATFPLPSAQRQLAVGAAEMARVLGSAPMLGSIRYASAVAHTCRAHGLTAFELAERAATAERHPANAAAVASDYAAVANRVLIAARTLATEGVA